MAVAEHRFRVMASEAQLVLVDPSPHAEATAVARLQELEQRWSRFLPGSDINQLANAGGAPVAVALDTCLLLETMAHAHHQTGGRFDPTMLREIVDAGYGVSVDDRARNSVTIDLPHPSAMVGDIVIGEGVAQLPEGMALDPGGIGKGLAADIVSSELVRGGTAGALVNIGGDLSAAGTPPSSSGWTVIVEDPFAHDASMLIVAIDAGGVATSSTRSRSWRRRGRRLHHILDPATGSSADTDLAAVTVFAPSAWEAEVHATAALLLGSGGSTGYLDGQTLCGIAVDLDGGCRATGDLGRAIRCVDAPADVPSA